MAAKIEARICPVGRYVLCEGWISLITLSTSLTCMAAPRYGINITTFFAIAFMSSIHTGPLLVSQSEYSAHGLNLNVLALKKLMGTIGTHTNVGFRRLTSKIWGATIITTMKDVVAITSLNRPEIEYSSELFEWKSASESPGKMLVIAEKQIILIILPKTWDGMMTDYSLGFKRLDI